MNQVYDEYSSACKISEQLLALSVSIIWNDSTKAPDDDIMCLLWKVVRST